MTQNTSIYWKNPETARRAKKLAGDQSVSAYLSALIDEQWEQLNPEPPIEGVECPTCQEVADFLFVAYWDDLEPGAKLYTCSACGTTKTERTIDEWNNGQKRPITEKMEAVS